uniref:FZ domain-containing protein n=1 Tax=Schistocephalus solidus TaxID=70667 RepID=A0A0X3NWY8_SCHSO
MYHSRLFELSCLLITICGLLARSDENRTVSKRAAVALLNHQAIGSGVWFNKGRMYPQCSALAYQEMDCVNFSLSQPPVAKSHLWQPDCDFLMKRLLCALYKINCPTIGQRSFQMYDIPCQSSCYATVAICGRKASSLGYGRGPREGVLPPGDYGLWHNPSTGSSQSVWPWRPLTSSSAMLTDTRAVEASPGRHNPGNSRINRVVRATSDVPANKDTTHSDEDEEEEEDQGDGQRTRAVTSREVPDGTAPRASRGLTWMRADSTDCTFLPSGGCDNWANGLTAAQNLFSGDFEAMSTQNPGCSLKNTEICKNMFPENFDKQSWTSGNFTAVKRTLKTDIQPYDEKVILTYAWPTDCVCPNQLTVGKRYLLLTHSKITRQSFTISTRSVFLNRVKRYTKRLLCWVGICPRRFSRNRKRRYPPNYPGRQQWQHWPGLRQQYWLPRTQTPTRVYSSHLIPSAS